MATEKKRKSNAELYQDYQSSANKKSQGENGENASERLSNRDLYMHYATSSLLEQNPTIIEDFNTRMKSFTDQYNSFFTTYRRKDFARNTANSLEAEAVELEKLLNDYGILFGDDYVSEATEFFNGVRGNLNKGVSYWSQWKTRDDYDTSVRMNNYYTKYQGKTAEDEAKALEELNLRYAEATAAGSDEAKLLQEEIDYLYNYGSRETQIAGRKKQYDYNSTEATRLDSEIKAIEGSIGKDKSAIVAEINSLETTMKERENYYRRMGNSYERSKELAAEANKKEATRLAELKKALEQLNPLAEQRDAIVAENNRYDRGEGTADRVYTEYKHIAEKPDYAELSKAGESKLGWGGLTGDARYDFINDIKGYRNIAGARGLMSGGGNYAAFERYSHMTEDEIGVYNYLYATEGKDSAEAYLKKLESALEIRSTDYQASIINEAVKNDPFSATVLNIGSVVAKPFGDLIAFADSVVSGKDYNPYSQWHTMSNNVNAIRTATTEAIEANTNTEFLGQNVWSQIYNAGMSTLDSLYGVAMFGKGYSLIASSGAAVNKAAELYKKGATGDQIFWGGTAAGLAEAIFEKVSIDNLIKAKNPDSVARMLLEALKQAGIEGSEEIATEIANIVSDNVIMGSQSDLYHAIKAYQEEGLSYEEARKKALQDKTTDVIWAGLSGMLSGGASGGITITHQGISNASAGKDIKKQGDTEAMIMAGIDAQQDSQAYKLAEKAFKDYTEGDGKVSNMRLGALKQTTMEDVVDQYRNRETLSESDIQAKLESKGIDSAEAAKFASIVTKVANGKKLSEREAAILNDNVVVKDIAEEVASDQANEAFFTQSQLAKIGSLGKETVTETPDTYKVSDDEGKTFIADSQEEVKIVDIASIKDGKMTLKVDNGTEQKEVDSSNIAYASNEEAILYEAVANMDMDAASARAIIGNFDAKSGLSANRYIYGAHEAFRYGKYNFAPEEMSKRGFSADLTEAQKTFAYNLGKNVQVSNVDTQESAVKKAIEGAQKGKKAQKAQKGKVYFESEETALTDRQKASKKALDIVAKALGINIYLYESTLDDKGRRAYTNKEGKRITANGWYDPTTGDIHIDINAGENGEGVMLFTAAHELTHFIRQWSPAKFKVLADFLMAEYGKEGVPVAELVRAQQDLARRQGRKLSYDTAYEEMIADSMQTMLSDGAVVEKLAKLAKQDKNLVEKMVDYINDLVKKIKDAYAEMTPYAKAGRYGAMLDEAERLQELFYDALVAAGENYRGAGGKIDVANAEMKLMARELGDDLGNIERTDNGDIALITNKDKSLVLYSPRTYEEGGREKLEATLKANGHTQEEINDTLKLLDDAADYMRILAAGYAKMNYGKLGERLSEHLEATATTDLKGHKQVLSTLVNNGDYPVNLDLALICKKRVAYMRLMNRLIEDGVFGDVVYGGDAIAEVNAILRENGFETACLGCFVESKRLQFQTWAEIIVQEWNEAVDAHTKNAGYFGFAKGDKGNLTEADMDAMEAELSVQEKNDKGNVNLGQGSAVTRMNRLLDKMPSLAKKLTVDDLLTPQGLTALRQADGNLFSIVKSRYGTASPKIVQEFSPYASEIANLTFNYVKKMTGESISGGQGYIRNAQKELATEKPVKQKGESKEDFKARKKVWDDKVETLAMNNYLFAIGGARIQSFSDFMIENVFDYIQIMADLAAKGSPLHGYTKEIACLRLFGMTGAKWNGSLIAHVDRSMGKKYAGLLPASEAKNGNAILVNTPEGEFAIGFDDYARHVATNKKTFIQSIGMKDIVALMLDPRYSANVGNITIGVSDMQILGMLDSPLFRFIIPYHASGMLPQFAQLVGVDFYNDYTNYQNTTVKQYFDLEGNPIETLKNAKGDALKPDMSFKYNEEVQKLVKAGVKDAPRKAADNYIAWCGNKDIHEVKDGDKVVGYATLNPKFSNTKDGTDFSKHKNYYKLLEDFNMYDNNTEAVALQGAVKMVLPSEANRLNAEQREAYKQALRDTGLFSDAEISKYAKKADMTFEEIIKAEMDNRQAYEEETDPKWDATVKKVEDHLKKHHPRDGQAKSADDYKEAKGDKAISRIKAVDGSYAFQLAPNEMKLSARDSEGNTLTEAQQEYFKDSKVRDKKGNLLVAYHGTEKGGFTVFSNSYSGDAYWFADKTTAESYIDTSAMGEKHWSGKGVTKLYGVYLNAKNPLIIDADGHLAINIPTDIFKEDGGKKKMHHIDDIALYAIDNGYDGLIVNNVRDYGLYTEESLGTDNVFDLPRGNVYAVFNANQIKDTTNTNPTSDPDIRYSEREYSYEALTSKPDMKITTVNGTVPNNRADVVVMAKKNAASVGKFHKDGSVSVYVDDIGTEVILSKKGLVHGLDRRLQEIAPVTVHAGEIIKNSIKINELIPSKKEADASYVLIGAAQNANGDMYIVRFVVNKYSNELTTMDVLYAINAKKSTAALNAPLVSTPNYRTEELAALNAPRLAAKPLSVTNSTISIAELLNYVNKYFPDVLPESVLRHYQHDRRPEGELGENALYSERDYAPTFYSKMGRVVEGVKQEKLGASSVIPMLTGKGVKAEEIRWSGIHTFLDGKKSVTKQELLDFINGSMLEIGEQMSSNNIDLRYDGSKRAYILYDESGNVVNTFTYNEFIGGYVSESDDEIYTDSVELEDALREEYGSMSSPRWGDYKLDGGSNYREIVFTMPNSSYSNKMMRIHWGEDAEGVIAHARIQDFEVNGKKMLFIEEMQSDWHNEGQKVGYEGKNFSKYIEERDSYISKKLADLYGKTTWDDLNSSYGYEIMGEKKYKSALASMEEIYAEWKKANPEKAKITDAEGIVPDAPFKDNYHEFVLKRLLRMAAEQGYDSIGWTTADIQSQRWSDAFAEGYRIEYDQDIPKFLNKYGRQWGAKVGTTTLKNSAEVWSMDITDAMRNSVLYEGQALYSERDPDAVSNRSLLANALENAAQNDIEKNKLKQYKEKIDFINAEERKLSDLNRQLRELRFSKGKRDTVKTKQINDLQAEATKTANRISVYDKQLLSLEASKPLKNILEREKAKAAKRQKQRDAEILQEQRDKANATIREIMNRNTESRKRAVEGRHKTVVRNKIKRVINDLNSVFNRGTKERNVKIGLRDTVRKALAASEVLFSDEITNEDIVRLGVDSVSAEEQEKLERYLELLIGIENAKKKSAELAQSEHFKKDSIFAKDIAYKIQENNRHIVSMKNQVSKLNKELESVFIRERARLNKENVSSALDSLAEAYASLQNSDDDYIKNNAFVQGMHDRIKSLSENLNGVTIKDMSLEQLEQVYKMYSSVKHMIVSANSIFRDGLREDLSKKIMTVQGEILALQKDNKKDPRVIVDAINNAIKSFDWNNQKPVYAFEKLGSQAFQELFWDAVKAEGVYAQDVVEAGDFLDAQKDKFKYADWDFRKATTFKSANGLDFKLTLADMMSIYAYSKRPQAFDHMTQGGFTFDRGSVYVDEKGRKRKHVRLSETYTVSIELINEIVKTLSEEQIGYVDAVQAYLTSLGEKGNEISRVLYGIDLFTEQVYFPLKSDADYRSSVEQALNETQTQVSLKNTGMTKQTAPHANNPIVLQGFDDVVLGHIDNMSKYHSFVLPIENLRRVFDNVSRDENASYDATKVIIESVFGESAKQYFDQYITDLNGGVHIGGYRNFMMDMFSKMKKTAVSASLSVVVQQPFAITRAMDMINPVYFAPVNINAAKKNTDAKSQWEELKRYAPVAIIKEMGGFDVGSSRTTRDYIGGTNYSGFGGRLKGFFKDSDYRHTSLDNIFMWGASKADELGWSTIWKAVKKEVASQHKELAVGSEEFLKKCGERFTEVVVYTQVYDSVNSRSGMMRSKRDLDKFATSFMGEPTTTINMVENSMLKLARAVKTKDGKTISKASVKMGRTIGVTLGSILLTSLAKSLVYAGRDDDEEDKALLERWAKSFGDSLTNDLNPLTMIPYLRDFVSIWDGWDVERPDMTVVADIVTSIKKAIDEGCTVEEALALIGNAGNALGLPVKNIIREAQGAINVFGDITDDIKPTDIGGAFAEGWSGEDKSTKDSLYQAIISGDDSRIAVLRAEYKTEEAYEQAIRKGLRENDPRIKEAAQARIDGDISEYSSIVREIKAEGHFSQDTIVAAVNAEINLINKEAKEQDAGSNDNDEEKATSIYKASDINAAFDNGDTNMALTIIEDLVNTKIANGMTEKEAKSSVRSSMTSYWKPIFLEAYNSKDSAEQQRIRRILIASGLYGRTSEVIDTTQQWIKDSKKK